jgi:hypothetical protein
MGSLEPMASPRRGGGGLAAEVHRATAVGEEALNVGLWAGAPHRRDIETIGNWCWARDVTRGP